MNRRNFIDKTAKLSLGLIALKPSLSFENRYQPGNNFADRLRPIGRALEMEGYYVWGNSPIMGDDGKVHVFFSRWVKERGMGGWLNGSEICHAVADTPESPFKFIDTVVAPRAGYFDETTCHNPTIKKIDDLYCLFYIGNNNKKTNTVRIGLATAKSLNGPWTRMDGPLLLPGGEGAWDDHNTSNPSFIKHPNGQYWLYYKSWNTEDYENEKGAVRGNRKYGLAIADNLKGPYKKIANNPIIDFSYKGNNAQLEDAYVWVEDGKFRMVARDMGYYNHVNGIIMESGDGIKWGNPEIAYYGLEHYKIKEPPPPPRLNKYGRFERPQILLINDRPAYLFTATQGGKYLTASSFIFKII